MLRVRLPLSAPTAQIFAGGVGGSKLPSYEGKAASEGAMPSANTPDVEYPVAVRE